MKTALTLSAFLAQLPKRRCALALLTGLAACAAGALLMGAAAWLITFAAYQPPLYTLAAGITLVRACGISRAVFRYLERLQSHKAVFALLTELRQWMYLQTEALLPSKGECALPLGDMLHGLINHVNEWRDFYLRGLNPLLTSFLFVTAGSIVLAFYQPIAGVLPLGAWLLVLLTSITAEKFSAATEPYGSYRSALLDIWQGLEEIHSHGSKAYYQAQLHEQSARLKNIQQKQTHITSAAEAIASGISALGWFIILLLLIPCVQSGALTLIQLAVCLLVSQTVLSEIQQLPAACHSWHKVREHQFHEKAQSTSSLTKQQFYEKNTLLKEGVPYHNNINPEYNTSPALSKAEQSTCLLAAENVSFAYGTNRPVLKNISFGIQAGEIVILPGESGCGKTTLFHLLMRLWEPDSGSFFLQGKPYREYTPSEVRQHFAASTQAGYVFSDSVRENFLRLYPRITESAIWQALRLALLAEDIAALPQKLDTPLGEDGCYLPGGQRQRLLLALAFASPAPILLLDEPTAGLDKKTAEQLLNNIHSAFPRRTILIITHDLELVTQSHIANQRTVHLFA